MSKFRRIWKLEHLARSAQAYLARHDSLTKLPNRFFMEEYMDKLFREQRLGVSALLFIDLDNFKIINDSYGHAAGDQLLRQIANLFQRTLRAQDFIARIGDDEFAVFLPNICLRDAKLMAEKLLEVLEQEEFYVGERLNLFRVTASIGLTVLDRPEGDSQAFLYADAALAAAKERGKNRVVVIEGAEERTKVAENKHILAMIAGALREDKFTLYLQPIYKTGDVVLHYEALVRMVDPSGELIPPGVFVPLAEQYGLMPAIDKWVIKKTLSVLEQQPQLTIFINLSGTSLGDEALLAWIERTILGGTIAPERIGFEITETTAIKDIDKVERWIHRLKALGCQFALDDFGVGFSSFAHLHTLPVDYLKIDGSFIRNLNNDDTKRALVQAMIAVAHTLGKQAIAEFVENEDIWRILHELRIDCGQGYFLGKPRPVEQCVDAG